MRILAIDPGTDKCGLAIVSQIDGIVLRQVLATGELVSRIMALIPEHGCARIVLGGGTGSQPIQRALADADLGIPVEMVDEAYTTLQARKRYFRENPPRGLWRLIPLGMQNPREPVDDYVAVILAEKWLQRSGNSSG